ncbi:MAG: hypothetical protein LQ346_004992 [Caloplaca aetnensis]|nr:MAG: hypothetical protein LQ346_004992 [Caloplaca aetnensis]
MIRVAVAGGTGGLGRTLVDELARGDEHTVFVLSRNPKLPFEAPANVHCLAAPYDSVDGLVNLLETNEIHTVISTLSPPSPAVQTTERNLIKAAAKSSTVKRFMPSEWGIDYSIDDERLPISWKAIKQQSIAELEKYPDLEYTMVLNGYFLDYFGMPHCQSYMFPEVPFIDIPAAKAAIPGSGDDKVTFTYTKDVAKFVRKLVESTSKWPRHSLIAGDVVTLNEVLEAAQQARGIKFDVVHDSLEDLRRGKISELPAYLAIYETFPKEFLLSMMAGFGVAMVTGVFVFEGELLNEKYPEVQTTKMRDFIKTHWTGR